MHLSCLGTVSCNISHPDIFSSYCREWLQSNGCQMVQVFFLSALEGWNCWWLWHPYVLIWQEIVHFSPRNNFRESYLSTTVEEKKWTLHFQPNKFISISNPHIYWFSATLSSPREITCQRKWRICANTQLCFLKEVCFCLLKLCLLPFIMLNKMLVQRCSMHKGTLFFQ